MEEEFRQWQPRPLGEVYPIVFLDGILVKVREDGRFRTFTIYMALGINLLGKKEILGLWVAQNEDGKFWMPVLTDLKNRGLQDIFIACVDGLTGFPDAIRSVYPETKVQLCVVHKVRHSLRYVRYRDRKGSPRT